ncbi:hypothetical protein F8M49_27445 [Rhodococcus zopfii]|uniref:Uncharacterized protein n=1 Tax=Rhodococcus zopfii TaxID=43772 RepID=A0ABU3WW49_9NOCA|nr:hypothetical protein [Rhodococcus zopfii]
MVADSGRTSAGRVSPDDIPFRDALAGLTADDWAELRALVSTIDDHQAPYGESDGSPFGGPVVTETMRFVDDRGLIVSFDWTAWEGKPIVERCDSAALAGASAEDCLRTLTVLSRADRFALGTLVEAFDRGLVQTLLHRLLETTGNA